MFVGKKRENKEKRLAYIRNIMETTGSTRVNASEIARVFNVSETAVRDDLKEIYKELTEKSKEKANSEIVKMDADLLRSLRILADYINSDRPASEKIRAIETQSRLFNDYVSNQSKRGLFTSQDKKKEDDFPVIVFTMGATDMEAFLKYCTKSGHPEVNELHTAFSNVVADEAVKERMSQDARLKGKGTVVVNSAADMREANRKHGLSVKAIAAALVDDDPSEPYFCPFCKTTDHGRDDLCVSKLKSLEHVPRDDISSKD